MTPPDTVACPPWCERHEESGYGWTHTWQLVDMDGVRVWLSYGGVFEGGPGETAPMLEILAPSPVGGGSEHIVVPATPELMVAFQAVAIAARAV